MVVITCAVFCRNHIEYIIVSSGVYFEEHKESSHLIKVASVIRWKSGFVSYVFIQNKSKAYFNGPGKHEW